MTELLVVVAIIVSLVGLAMPVLSRSVRSGYQADEMAAMKQIGVARGLYQVDYQDTFSIAQLVDAKYLSASVLKSGRDPESMGAANKIILHDVGPQIPYSTFAYPVTYYDIYSYQSVKTARAINALVESGHSAVGWVFSPANLDPPDAGGTPYFGRKGTYQRLLLDGAVVTRSMDNIFPCRYLTGGKQAQSGFQVSRDAAYADFTAKDALAISTNCGQEFAGYP